jgi:uncharacterized protein (TIGR02271 family)
VEIRLDNGQQLLVPTEMLMRQQDGSYYLSLSPPEVEQFGRRDADSSETLVVPVIVEELEVQKRTVETGKVRITKVVHERETIVDEPFFRDEIEVECVLIDRAVDAPVPVRYEDNTMIVPIMEEVLVVEKRLLLKEELYIRKRRVETHRPQQVILRSEEVCVERLEATGKSK